MDVKGNRVVLRAIVWMLRATVWMLRATVWMLRANVWMLRAPVWKNTHEPETLPPDGAYCGIL
eukprot:3086892-Pyramimonas_sp.AAC.2